MKSTQYLSVSGAFKHPGLICVLYTCVHHVSQDLPYRTHFNLGKLSCLSRRVCSISCTMRLVPASLACDTLNRGSRKATGNAFVISTVLYFVATYKYPIVQHPKIWVPNESQKAHSKCKCASYTVNMPETWLYSSFLIHQIPNLDDSTKKKHWL